MLTIKSLFLVGARARDQFFLISLIYSNTCLARGATVRVNGLRTSGKYRQKVPMNPEREIYTIIITLTQVVVQYRTLTINFVRFLVNRRGGRAIQNIDNLFAFWLILGGGG